MHLIKIISHKGLEYTIFSGKPYQSIYIRYNQRNTSVMIICSKNAHGNGSNIISVVKTILGWTHLSYFVHTAIIGYFLKDGTQIDHLQKACQCFLI